MAFVRPMLALWLLQIHCLVLCAPANGPSLVAVAKAAPNASLGHLNLPTYSPEYFIYDIPHTNRFVGMIIDKDEAIPPGCFTLLVDEVKRDVQLHLLAHGDGPLAAADNPYDLEAESSETPGCYISIASEPSTEITLLTYGMIEEAMVALDRVLVRTDRNFAVDFAMDDRSGTKYGKGRLAIMDDDTLE